MAPVVHLEPASASAVPSKINPQSIAEAQLLNWPAEPQLLLNSAHDLLPPQPRAPLAHATHVAIVPTANGTRAVVMRSNVLPADHQEFTLNAPATNQPGGPVTLTVSPESVESPVDSREPTQEAWNSAAKPMLPMELPQQVAPVEDTDSARFDRLAAPRESPLQRSLHQEPNTDFGDRFQRRDEEPTPAVAASTNLLLDPDSSPVQPLEQTQNTFGADTLPEIDDQDFPRNTDQEMLRDLPEMESTLPPSTPPAVENSNLGEKTAPGDLNDALGGMNDVNQDAGNADKELEKMLEELENLDEDQTQTDMEDFPSLDDDLRDDAGSIDAADAPKSKPEMPCDSIYNERNCCAESAECSTVLKSLRSDSLRNISLDISPPMYTKDADEEALRRIRERLAEAPSRSWSNRQGHEVATGVLDDFRDGMIYVRGDGGDTTPIRYRDLGNEDICFVNAWWNLPAECNFTDEAPPIRDFTMITYTWTASALGHKPLYFEDVQLERYGHSAGPLLQPLASGVHFFSNIAMLPYGMRLHPPNECVYTLGHYRPGSCAPWLIPAFRFSTEAALTEAAAVTGMWGIMK